MNIHKYKCVNICVVRGGNNVGVCMYTYIHVSERESVCVCKWVFEYIQMHIIWIHTFMCERVCEY